MNEEVQGPHHLNFQMLHQSLSCSLFSEFIKTKRFPVVFICLNPLEKSIHLTLNNTFYVTFMLCRPF